MPRQRQFVRQAPKRKLVWARKLQDNALTLTGIAPAHSDLLDNFHLRLGSQVLGATVTRIRLDVLIDGTLGSLAHGGVVMGIHVGHDEVEPEDHNPSGQLELDWMYWRHLRLVHPQAGGPGTERAATYEIDVKAQRKMEELQETLWAVFVNLNAGENYEVRYSSSVLLKLP